MKFTIMAGLFWQALLNIILLAGNITKVFFLLPNRGQEERIEKNEIVNVVFLTNEIGRKKGFQILGGNFHAV